MQPKLLTDQTAGLPIDDSSNAPLALHFEPAQPSVAAKAPQSLSSLQEIAATRLDHLLEISADGLMDWDLVTNQAYLSPRWLSLMDYWRHDVLPKDIIETTQHIHPDDLDEVLSATNQCLTGNQNRLEREYRIAHRNGEVRWLHARGLVKQDPSGLPIRYILSLRDVTVRRESTEKLRETEERVRILTNVAPIMLWMSDAQGNYLFANKQMLEFVGKLDERLTTTDWKRLVHLDDRRTLRNIFIEAANRQIPFECEFRLLRADKQHRNMLCSGKPRFSEQGEFLGYVGSCVDITERKQAEQALRDNEAKFRLLVENTADAIAVLNEHIEVIYISPSAEKIFGHKATELLGNQVFDQIHPDDLDRVRRLLKHGARSRGFGPNVVFRLRNRSGEWRWAEAQGNNLLQEPNVRSIVINIRDVTERTLAEERVRQSEALYRTVFESVSDGLRLSDVVTDETIEVNTAWCTMHGYTREEAMKLKVIDFVPGNGFVLFPANWLDSVRESGVVRGKSVNLRKDGTAFPVDVRAQNTSLVTENMALAVVRDITEQVQAMELLERRVQERTRELSQLLAATQVLSSTLDLRTLLQLIVDQMGAVIDHRAINLFLVDESDIFKLVAHGGMQTQSRLQQLALWPFTELDREVIRSRRPLLIPNVRAETHEADVWREDIAPRLIDDVNSVSAWMNVPLVTRDRVVGAIMLDHAQENFYTAAHVELVQAFANQASAAISNATLFEAEQRRYRESERRRNVAEGLRDILRVLNSNQPIEGILGYVLERAGGLLGTDTIALFKLDSLNQVLTVQARHGLWKEYEDTVVLPVGCGIAGKAVEARAPIIGLSGEILSDPRLADNPVLLAMLKRVSDMTHQILAVPLVIKDEVYGALTFFYIDDREIGLEEIELAQSLTDQVALALENARLREDSVRMAAIAERTRLARELHDSVSQALYGIALGARTARELVDTSPQRAIEPLEYVLTLVQGGLAEMRALIFELRPESLATEGLVAAFQKQADALCARHGIDVVFEPVSEPPLSLDSKEALYRIALEAIQNTIKHAGASQVTLRLNTKDAEFGRRQVVLEIQDNGRGFDTLQPYPGHIGLQSMRERAESLGGSLQLTSQVGTGTTVTATVPSAHATAK